MEHRLASELSVDEAGHRNPYKVYIHWRITGPVGRHRTVDTVGEPFVRPFFTVHLPVTSFTGKRNPARI